MGTKQAVSAISFTTPSVLPFNCPGHKYSSDVFMQCLYNSRVLKAAFSFMEKELATRVAASVFIVLAPKYSGKTHLLEFLRSKALNTLSKECAQIVKIEKEEDVEEHKLENLQNVILFINKADEVFETDRQQLKLLNLLNLAVLNPERQVRIILSVSSNSFATMPDLLSRLQSFPSFGFDGSDINYIDIVLNKRLADYGITLPNKTFKALSGLAKNVILEQSTHRINMLKLEKLEKICIEISKQNLHSLTAELIEDICKSL